MFGGPAAGTGYVYPHPVHRVECLAPAPYPLTTDVVASGIGMATHADRVAPRRQTLDMATGELLTEMDFEPEPGVRIAVSVLQFASRGTPSLVCQEIALSSDSVVAVAVPFLETASAAAPENPELESRPGTVSPPTAQRGRRARPSPVCSECLWIPPRPVY